MLAGFCSNSADRRPVFSETSSGSHSERSHRCCVEFTESAHDSTTTASIPEKVIDDSNLWQKPKAVNMPNKIMAITNSKEDGHEFSPNQPTTLRKEEPKGTPES